MTLYHRPLRDRISKVGELRLTRPTASGSVQVARERSRGTCTQSCCSTAQCRKSSSTRLPYLAKQAVEHVPSPLHLDRQERPFSQSGLFKQSCVGKEHFCTKHFGSTPTLFPSFAYCASSFSARAGYNGPGPLRIPPPLTPTQPPLNINKATLGR